VKPRALLSIVVLLSLVLATVPAPMAAQEAASPPDQGTWTLGPTMCFDLTRIDAEYFPTTGKVYILGGRSGTTTVGNIYAFDAAAGTCVDTGTVMPTPISNYTVNLVNDGTNDLLCTFGGRDSAGAVTLNVQCYNPVANTAAIKTTLPAAWTGYTPGAQVVVDNMVYIFGGFNSLAAPYMTARTERYNPVANTFTQLGDLSLARSYLLAGVVDGKIYAFGGDTFDGAALVAQTMAEVMADPAGAGTWDDAAVADLPIAGDEGRAFAFDSDSPYEFAGQIVLATMAQWSGASAEVVLYDVATNAYDTTFPDLINARRNHADALIPLCTGDPADGLPGMWVFGGYLTGDTPPYAPTEYFPLGCPAGPAVYLSPASQQGSGGPGTVVTYDLTLTNDIGQEDTFDIVYTSIWTTTGPLTVGPVPDGGEQAFQVQVTIPAGAQCVDSDLATLTAWDSTSTYSDTAELLTTVVGELAGAVYDANTGLPIENARVSVTGVTDPSFYVEQLTNAAGQYSFLPVPAGDYLITASADGYYAVLELPLTIATCTTVVQDFSLDASDPDLQPKTVSVDVTVDHTSTYNMALENNGSGDLNFHITELEATRGLSPNKADMPMPSGVDPQVYADLKASADGTGKFIVYLKDQADLSTAFNIDDWSARGQYVLDTLRATAQRSQAGLLAALDGAGVEYESRYIVNAVVVTGNAALVDSIAARPEVGFIGPDTKMSLIEPVATSPAPDGPETIEWNIKKIVADSVWADFGVTGQGIVLASIDTGAQYDHPALVQQYRGNLGGGSYDHDYNWWDPWTGSAQPSDVAGHGTHTIGTMVGSDDPTNPISATNAIGVAPGAKWIACHGLNDSGWGSDAVLLECAEFILAPWDLNGANPDPGMRPDAVNNSWGGGQAAWVWDQAVYAWRAAGIWPSFSNGNDGPNCGTAENPGDMDNAISAGATSSTDVIASFSSRGPAAVTGIIKPDVSAPGANVRSSVPTNGYANYSGTSMASPHVAATAGLIWSAVPELRGNVQVTEWIMEQTADAILDTQCGAAGPPNNVYGWGRINAYNAVDYAVGGTWDVPWLTVDPVSGVVEPSATQPIVLTFDATGLAIGCYDAQLKVEYNDPYVVEEYIPVEMCVVEAFRYYLPIITKAYP
jgi:hypothetical protein